VRVGQLVEGIPCDGGNAGLAETRAAGAGWTVRAARAVRRVGVLARFKRVAELGHGAVNLTDRGGRALSVSIDGAVFQNSSMLHYLSNRTARPHG